MRVCVHAGLHVCDSMCLLSPPAVGSERGAGCVEIRGALPCVYVD